MITSATFVIIGSIMIGLGSVVFLLQQERTRARESMTFLDESEQSDEIRQAGMAAVQARINRRIARIYTKALAQGRITNDDVEDMFCIGDRTASRYLRVLVDQNKLVKKGEGRATYYEPVQVAQ
jgi:predicted HTH transcriptional regulator